MNKAQLNAKKQIEEILCKMTSNYSFPSDKEIIEFANLFYLRDKDYQIGTDVEMLAVARGIVQGMQIMRTIVEKNKCKKS